MKAYALRDKETGQLYRRRTRQRTPALWTSRQGPASAKGHCGCETEIVEYNVTPADKITLSVTPNQFAVIMTWLPERLQLKALLKQQKEQYKCSS